MTDNAGLQAALEAAEASYRKSLNLEAPITEAELDAEHRRCEDKAQAVFEAMAASLEPALRTEGLAKLLQSLEQHFADVSRAKRVQLQIKASEEALRNELEATRAQLAAERAAAEEARRKEQAAADAQMAAMQQEMHAANHRMNTFAAAQMAAQRRRRRVATAVAVSHVAHHRRQRGQPGCSIQ